LLPVLTYSLSKELFLYFNCSLKAKRLLVIECSPPFPFSISPTSPEETIYEYSSCTVCKPPASELGFPSPYCSLQVASAMLLLTLLASDLLMWAIPEGRTRHKGNPAGCFLLCRFLGKSQPQTADKEVEGSAARKAARKPPVPGDFQWPPD